MSKLSGLTFKQANGKELEHGASTQDVDICKRGVPSDVLVVKMLAAQTNGDDLGSIEAVELIRVDEGGQLPVWSLVHSIFSCLTECQSSL